MTGHNSLNFVQCAGLEAIFVRNFSGGLLIGDTLIALCHNFPLIFTALNRLIAASNLFCDVFIGPAVLKKWNE